MTTTATPPEPPVRTLVRDRHGAVHRRYPDGWGPRWGNDMCHFGVWAAMWEARGPLVEVTETELDAEQARPADDWEDRWRNVARQPLGPSDEVEAWRIARYALVNRTPLSAAETAKLSSAYLRLLAQVGRAGLPEEAAADAEVARATADHPTED